MDYIAEYAPYILDPPDGSPYLNPIVGVNFKPNDGVNAEQIVNWHGENPDYMIVCEEGTSAIVSRWFVTESARLRNGQFRMSLQRDLPADYYDEIMSATVFLERGWINDTRSAFLYQDETLSFNQIRQSTRYLWDETYMPWIVGYIPRDQAGGTITVKMTAPIGDVYELEQGQTLESFASQNHLDRPAWTDAVVGVDFAVIGRSGISAVYGTNTVAYQRRELTSAPVMITAEPADVIQPLLMRYKPSGVSAWANAITNLMQNRSITQADISGTNFDAINAMTNKIIKTADGQFYKIVTSIRQMLTSWDGYTDADFVDNAPQQINATIRNVITTSGSSFEQNPNIDQTTLYNYTNFAIYGTTITAELQHVSEFETLIVDIPAPAMRKHLDAEPFDVFCMPFSNGSVYASPTSSETYIGSRSINQIIATGVTNPESGAAKIFDVQVLPYCPIANIMGVRNGKTYVNYDFADSTIRVADGESTRIVGFMWWMSGASTITKTRKLPARIYPASNALDGKVRAQYEFARICSPSYSNMFEFVPVKNGGVDRFLIQMQVKPFNPWIKVTPFFEFLYGTQDVYHDARGLVLQGDFSMAQASDAWVNYELENKNYQAIFNRQIENLEFKSRMAIANDVMSAASGVASQTAMFGKTGGVLSAIGGAADIAMSYAQRAEGIDLERDLFRMRIGNIKAIPNGIAKTSALSPLNTLVPTLEIWTTTPDEQQLVDTYITETSMLCGFITSDISRYMSPELPRTYIKGQIIRIDVPDDAHVAHEINRILSQGLYFALRKPV